MQPELRARLFTRRGRTSLEMAGSGSQQRAEHQRVESHTPIEGAGDLEQQLRWIVVSFVQRNPRDGLGRRLRELTQKGRFPVPRGSAHHHHCRVQRKDLVQQLPPR